MGLLKNLLCFGDFPHAKHPEDRGRGVMKEAVGPIPGAFDFVVWFKSVRLGGKDPKANAAASDRRRKV